MKKILILTMMAVIGLMVQAAVKQPEVKISDGALRGVETDGVDAFLGIPYAEPPVDSLRWRAPQPVKPWQGMRDADRPGPSSMQFSRSDYGKRFAVGASEDCLYLNLWRPAGEARNLPVMVWFHGGGFVEGSGSDPMFEGLAFARQGVILVTVTYRLGVFGFYSHPALTAEHPEEFKSNYAFMDMMAALRWVRDNIAAFGGNPSNVTIFGESAGGAAVNALLTMPAARGLFQKAIIMSGAGRRGFASSEDAAEAEQKGVAFARRHGVTDMGAAGLAALRALPADSLLSDVIAGNYEEVMKTYTGPIIDGRLVVEAAQNAYEAGHMARVPLMVGSTDAEDSGGWTPRKTLDEVFAVFGDKAAEARRLYDPDGKGDVVTVGSMFITDRCFSEQARYVARMFERAGLPAYVYRFGYVTKSLRPHFQMGANHASELGYVFDTLPTRVGATSITPDDGKVASLMNTYFANFAKNGNPNGPGLAEWPLNDASTNMILEVLPDATATGHRDPRTRRLDLIEAIPGPVTQSFGNP